MRDNYVGDVGDFFKYGLLRCFSGGESRLGVVWYLYPDRCKATDGLHLDYLNAKHRDRFEICDKKLFQQLDRLINDKARSVSEVRERCILPKGTVFFEEPLSYRNLPKGTSQAIGQRLQHRQGWIDRALSKTARCTHVFFDPDNGLQVDSVPKHRDKAAKFCYFDDLAPFWSRGQSLIVYQHCNRNDCVPSQIAKREEQLRDCCEGAAFVRGIHLSSYGGRVFFIIAQDMHVANLDAGLSTFERNFGKHIAKKRSLVLN